MIFNPVFVKNGGESGVEHVQVMYENGAFGPDEITVAIGDSTYKLSVGYELYPYKDRQTIGVYADTGDIRIINVWIEDNILCIKVMAKAQFEVGI